MNLRFRARLYVRGPTNEYWSIDNCFQRRMRQNILGTKLRQKHVTIQIDKYVVSSTEFSVTKIKYQIDDDVTISVVNAASKAQSEIFRNSMWLNFA